MRDVAHSGGSNAVTTRGNRDFDRNSATLRDLENCLLVMNSIVNHQADFGEKPAVNRGYSTKTAD